MSALPDRMLRDEGMRVLRERFGLVDAQRFIMLINREHFDYTQWREKNLHDDTLDIDALSARLMKESRESHEKPEDVT